MGWLADDLIHSLSLVPGSNERDQLASLLRSAERVRLSAAFAEAAAATVRDGCHGIERNLDRLRFDTPALWLEYDHAPRLAAFGGGAAGVHPPETVGCLVARDPEAGDHVAVFVAWRFANGKVHHSYAILHWDLARLFSLSAASPPRDDGGAADRLMEAAGVDIPPGLMGEMEIWQGYDAANHPWRDLAVEQTMRDASGEHIFLLSALMLLGSSATETVPWTPPPPDNVPANDDGEGGGAAAGEAAAAPAGWREARLRPGLTRPWPWSRGGFEAVPFSGTLGWSPIRARR